MRHQAYVATLTTGRNAVCPIVQRTYLRAGTGIAFYLSRGLRNDVSGIEVDLSGICSKPSCKSRCLPHGLITSTASQTRWCWEGTVSLARDLEGRNTMHSAELQSGLSEFDLGYYGWRVVLVACFGVMAGFGSEGSSRLYAPNCGTGLSTERTGPYSPIA